MISSVRIGAVYTNFRRNRFRLVEREIPESEQVLGYDFKGKSVALTGTGKTYMIVETNNRGKYHGGVRTPIRESVLKDWAHKEIKQ